MTVTLTEVAQTAFRTSRTADDINERLRLALGMRHRYGPARLAIARSLAMLEPPSRQPVQADEPGRVIRGDPLFGNQSDLGAWTALLTERAGRPLGRAELQDLVAAHWHRGATLLCEEWEHAGRDYARFVTGLCERAGLRGYLGPEGTTDQPGAPTIPVDENRPVNPVTLQLGEPGTDLGTGQPLSWTMNASGRSPHIAAMGTLGTGKTRIAMALLRQIRQQAGCAVVAFDFKGDLAENVELAPALGAMVVNPLRTPIPLDVLARAGVESQDLDIAAQRFRESFIRISVSRPGAIQQDSLREAARRAFRRAGPVRLEDVRHELVELYDELERKPDGVIATFNDVCAFALFAPELAPEAFFRRSWIIDLHDMPETAQRLVAFLLVDALCVWLMRRKDTPLDARGNRRLDIVLAIDEARRILGYQQPSVIEIVRMSRSKGGAVVLISQSPDDFVGEDEDFLANIGLVFSFRTNAKPGSLTRVFGERVDLAGLPDGVCVTRLPDPARRRPIKVQAWKP